MKNKHRLPEMIGTETHFTWGPVEKIHRIPDLNLIIIEYHSDIFENCQATGEYEEKTTFHLHGTSSSLPSLSDAIIFGIARFHKVDDFYARACCKLLDQNWNGPHTQGE